MGFFFKKKQEPERTNDQRLENLAKIKRSYTTVGVYGEGLSPSELERRIKTAYKDMEQLIRCERTCRNLGGEEGTNFEHYDFGCSACGLASDICEPNFCPNCGARVID